MSIVVEVRFPAERLPSPKAWQESIRSNGFAIEIHHDFAPVTFTGFLPASYKDQPAGFEYYYDLEADEQACVSLKWSGNAREAVSGLIAAACLCELTAGRLVDTESGETIEASSAIAWGRQCEADFRQLLEEENVLPATTARPVSKPWWKLW